MTKKETLHVRAAGADAQVLADDIGHQHENLPVKNWFNLELASL
jgi:hypothetical protein